MLVQALHLRSARIAAPALQLVEQYLSEFSSTDMFHVGALLERARCLEALERIDEAETAYLAALAEQRGIKNYVTLVYLDFPWFAVTYGRRHVYSEALAALDEGASGFVFPAMQYQACAVKALIASEYGDFAAARNHAVQALQAAAARHSGFRYHPDVGLVGETDSQMHSRVTQLANMPLQPSSGAQLGVQ